MTNGNVQGLDTLEAWKRSKDFAVKVYKEVLPLLPDAEKWNLDQQIRRAVFSVPANIAEGHGRFYYKELKQDIEELIRIINGYIAYLKRSKIGANEPGANYSTREDAAPYICADPEVYKPWKLINPSAYFLFPISDCLFL